MSSYLDKQRAAFSKGAVSSASQVAIKQSLAPPVPESAPSPAASVASNASKNESKDNKRKREPSGVVYSQPAATGYGTEAFTQVTYVIEFLKKKAEPKTFREILEYLSLVHVLEGQKKLIAQILRKHDRVEWIQDPNLKTQAWDSGTFAHRPIIPVRNKKDLIAYLQNKSSAHGVTVKDLKDGWLNCEEAINELEQEYKILVTRTKKDNHARMIWSNDPTLIHSVDPEFQVMWHKTELPSVDELVRKLLEAGQKPASEDPSKRIKAPPKAKQKAKRAARRGGKVTNNHMAVSISCFCELLDANTELKALAQGLFLQEAVEVGDTVGGYIGEKSDQDGQTLCKSGSRGGKIDPALGLCIAFGDEACSDGVGVLRHRPIDWQVCLGIDWAHWKSLCGRRFAIHLLNIKKVFSL